MKKEEGRKMKRRMDSKNPKGSVVAPHAAEGDARRRGKVVALGTTEGDVGGAMHLTEVEVEGEGRGEGERGLCGLEKVYLA